MACDKLKLINDNWILRNEKVLINDHLISTFDKYRCKNGNLRLERNEMVRQKFHHKI